MKHTNKLMAALIATVLMVSSAMAQAPQKMSYQSVIRNAIGALVANQAVGVKISLLQGSATGTAVYVETQNPTTNANGLASFQIGGGTVVSGSFANINWAAGPYFVKTETDPTGGSNYSIAGTTQLLSVAYALYAANSGTQGAKGDSGVSIRNTKVNGDSLFVTLSNGQSLNAGNVRGLTGAAGQNAFGAPNDGGVVKNIFTNDSTIKVPADKVWKVNYMPVYGPTSAGKNTANLISFYYDGSISLPSDLWLASNDVIQFSKTEYPNGVETNYINNKGIILTEYPASQVNIKTFFDSIPHNGSDVILQVPNGKNWKINYYTTLNIWAGGRGRLFPDLFFGSDLSQMVMFSPFNGALGNLGSAGQLIVTSNNFIKLHNFSPNTNSGSNASTFYYFLSITEY
jgi:hypothetical protein